MLATGAMSPDEIEVELFVERRIHCVRRDDQEQRVAIRPRDDDNFGTDTAGRISERAAPTTIRP